MEAHQFCTNWHSSVTHYLMVETFWEECEWLGKAQVHRQEDGEGVHVGESESFRPSLLRGGSDSERSRSERE